MAIQKKSITTLEHIQPDKVDWEILLQLANRHKVRPLLFKGIQKWEINPPNDFIEKLKKLNFQITTRNLNHTKELLELLSLFAKEKIEVLPYKGILLAQEAYQDLNAREYSDIDLLINKVDLPRIIRILENRNYRSELNIPEHLLPHFMKQYYEFNFDLVENGRRVFHLEPHWMIGPKMFQLAFGFQDFTLVMQQKKIWGRTMTIFTPAGLLLSTCLHHGGQDQWRNLKQVSDMAAILNQFQHQIDWKHLLGISRKWKVENLLLLGVGLAAELFQLPLPPVLKQPVHNKKIQQYIHWHISSLETFNQLKLFSKEGIWEGLRYHFVLRSHWSTKIKIAYYHFLKFLLPNENDINLKHTASDNYWMLLLKKPFRLWSTYFKKPKL